MKPVSPNAQVGGQRPVYAPEESPPCPSLPHPETNIESGRIGPQQGKERVLALLLPSRMSPVLSTIINIIYLWLTTV